jgi:gluconate 2-dehydrogenase alpha chain
VVTYQSTHVQGRRIMAPTPDCGVVNPHLQDLQIPNLFALGASTFSNTGSANPTPTILALAYRTADGIDDRYLKKSAPFA